MLKARVLTGVVLISAFLAAVFFLPTEWFATTVFAVMLIGAWEWSRLVELEISGRIALILGLAFGAVVLQALGGASPLLLGLGVLWWLLVVILLALYPKIKHGSGWRRFLLFAAFPTLLPAWLALSELHERSVYLVLFLLLTTAIADTAAYFSGKTWGKTKLAPAVSPGKTREGLLGALIAIGLWALLGAWWFELPNQEWLLFISLCLLVTLASVSGDLLESVLKRQAGAKDSGRILPGHGGVLDRIDSLTAAAPVFTLGLFWLSL